jgi:hypothetical protein
MRNGVATNLQTFAFWKYTPILHFVLTMNIVTGLIVTGFVVKQPPSIQYGPSLYSINQPLAICHATTSSDIDYVMQQSELLDDFQVKGSLIVLAIALGLLSQILINSMLKGDQGLGAFLSDGKGYGKSKFKPYTKGKDTKKKDPLPWLKLPKFEYVEVAGQENDSIDQEKEKARDLEMASGTGYKDIQHEDYRMNK